MSRPSSNKADLNSTRSTTPIYAMCLPKSMNFENFIFGAVLYLWVDVYGPGAENVLSSCDIFFLVSFRNPIRQFFMNICRALFYSALLAFCTEIFNGYELVEALECHNRSYCIHIQPSYCCQSFFKETRNGITLHLINLFEVLRYK